MAPLFMPARSATAVGQLLEFDDKLRFAKLSQSGQSRKRKYEEDQHLLLDRGLEEWFLEDFLKREMFGIRRRRIIWSLGRGGCEHHSQQVSTRTISDRLFACLFLFYKRSHKSSHKKTHTVSIRTWIRFLFWVGAIKNLCPVGSGKEFFHFVHSVFFFCPFNTWVWLRGFQSWLQWCPVEWQ